MNRLWRAIARRYGTSLRRRVRLGVAIVLLIMVALVVTSVMLFVYRTEQHVWQARQNDAAHHAASVVDTFLFDVQGDLMLVGALSESQLLASEMLDHLVWQNDALLEAVRFDSEGRVLMSASQPGSTPVLSNLFTLTLSSWFADARDGVPYISKMQVSAANEPYLILAVPATGQGVVAARLGMTVLWDVVRQIHYGDTGRAYVVDQDGSVIAHSDPQVVLAVSRVDEYPDMTLALGEPSAWLGEYTNFEGVPVLGSAVPIVNGQWTIVAEISQEESWRTTRRALLLSGISTVILGGMFFLAANMLISRAVLRPLELLRQGARRLGEGHLNEKIIPRLHDEIGALAEEFNAMASALAGLIARTEELAAKANEANEFKSRLISRVSHELRNPLGGILGFSEMLQYGIYGALTSEQASAVGRIMTSAHYLNKLVNELLEQSRLEGQQVALTVSEFDPRQVIQAQIAISESLASQKGVALTVELDESAPARVMLDATKLEQVIANLISNALKFTNAGAVTVRLFGVDAARWAVAVRDTGIGIPVEAQEFIFEPFRQVDETITRKHEGFGLGLSIVKHFVTLMNGQIALESAPGQGSTFTVTLPRQLLGERDVLPDEPGAAAPEVPAPVTERAAVSPLAEGVAEIEHEAQPVAR